MDLKFIANFLDKTFFSFDYNLLKIFHDFAINTNNFFTLFFKAITFITEKGIIFIILSIILMLFKKTRKIGICMFGAISIGAIISNFILKDSVCRIRPYKSNEIFNEWWTFVGSNKESGFSFPSGHTTAAMASVICLFMYYNKKYSFIYLFVGLLVGISRIYLVAHYPTDVIGAIIVGIIAFVLSYIITKIIYYFLHKYNNKLFKFILNFNLL